MVLDGAAVAALQRASAALPRVELIQRVVELSETCAQQLDTIHRQKQEIHALQLVQKLNAAGLVCVTERPATPLPSGRSEKLCDLEAAQEGTQHPHSSQPHASGTGSMLALLSPISLAGAVPGTTPRPRRIGTDSSAQNSKGLHISAAETSGQTVSQATLQPDTEYDIGLDAAPLSDHGTTATASDDQLDSATHLQHLPYPPAPVVPAEVDLSPTVSAASFPTPHLKTGTGSDSARFAADGVPQGLQASASAAVPKSHQSLAAVSEANHAGIPFIEQTMQVSIVAKVSSNSSGIAESMSPVGSSWSYCDDRKTCMQAFLENYVVAGYKPL